MIRPLFPFYGSKWRDARRYPVPTATVIEPFAGSAGYSLFHEPEKVLLYDVDPIIVAVWNYLIKVSPGEVLKLPDLEPNQSVDALRVPQEARWLIGFWLNRGSATLKKRQTAFSSRTDRSQLTWSARARERIATSLERVRRWKIFQGSYEDVQLQEEATYFVDPPYVDKGRFYRFHSINYENLSTWCHGLQGRVIVCEQAGATWLPFEPLAVIKSTKGQSAEVLFTRGVE